MSQSTIILLETERLRLRRWKQEDKVPFSAMNSDPRVTEFLSRSLSREESDSLVDRIERSFDECGYGLNAVELKEDGSFIGFIGLKNVGFEAHFTPATEIGWRLDSGFWGKGYASEGARAVLADAFERLGMKEIVSFTVPHNKRSIKVMKK